MTILIILAIVIGIRHAFEPDHVAAVLTVSTQSNSLSATATQGALWGVGHTITLVLFSMMLIGLQIEISDSVFITFEFIVGIILILMGIDVLKKLKLQYDSGESIKSHTKYVKNNKTRLSLKIMGVGLLHGAAGSGVIIALITTSIESIYLKFAYIAIFSLGLIFCMSLLSILMSIPLHIQFKLVHLRYIKAAAGTLAILVGMKMLYQTSIQISALII